MFRTERLEIFLKRDRRRIILLPMFILIGAAVGFFIIYPINEFVYFHEHEPEAANWRQFVFGQMKESLNGKTPYKTAFYATMGAVVGLIFAWIYTIILRNVLRVEQLRKELGSDIERLIAQGEGQRLEFKSSLRWDYKQEKANKNLEHVIAKTIAGYMNANGGTLLIGVADDGEILGIEKDMKTLKWPNRDSYELAITTVISNYLGTDLCKHTQTIFKSIEDKDVCRIIVRPSARPAFLKQGSQTQFYVRTGGSTRELNIEEATNYIADRWR
jgi:hypothetical protein